MAGTSEAPQQEPGTQANAEPEVPETGHEKAARALTGLTEELGLYDQAPAARRELCPFCPAGFGTCGHPTGPGPRIEEH